MTTEALAASPTASLPDTGAHTSAVRHITTITKRELSAYFTSPVAYVFIVFFLLLCGFFTFMVGQVLSTRRGLVDLVLHLAPLALPVPRARGRHARLVRGTSLGHDRVAA